MNVAAAKESKKQHLILTASLQDSRDEWVLDSGASFHITPNKEVLFDLKEASGGKVLVGTIRLVRLKELAKFALRAMMVRLWF